MMAVLPKSKIVSNSITALYQIEEIVQVKNNISLNMVVYKAFRALYYAPTLHLNCQLS